jgi:hypothetical protein
MATFYLDFEGGDDNHAGTSFATLASGTDGRLTSTGTFSSAGANFPNDDTLVGQYLSFFNGNDYAVYNITAWVSSTSLTVESISGGTGLSNQTVDRQYYIGGRWKNITTGARSARTIPGDTIRIMGSPAPTSLGQNGVWTSQALQATKTLTAATNATPIAITITGHGYSTGDTVVVTGVVGNTAANGTWEITVTDANTFTLDGSAGNGNRTSGGTARLRNNTRVMLASAVTQNIASTGPGRAAWTASANVATLLDTGSSKEHGVADRIAIDVGFTTGLAAYWATPNTLDLSGYQQVSFWIRQTTGTVGAAGAIDLRLCSDAAGTTAVNTISIPNLGATGRWMPVTVDLGTALGSSIQSIALYVNTDNGAQTFQISNIIACKASSEPDSLTLTSLIGKNTTGETFWGIQSINGTRVMLDADTNATPTSTSVRGYYGTSETVTTYKRETIKLGPAAAATTNLQITQESGSVSGGPITYSGGWDRTNMSTQNLETWLDGQNGNGYGISINVLVNLTFEKIAFVRCAAGFFGNGGTSNIANIIAVNNCTTTAARGGLYVVSEKGCHYTVGHIVANANLGVYISTASNCTIVVDNAILSHSNQGISVFNDFNGQKLKGSGAGLIANNGGSGLLVRQSSVNCKSLTFADNAVSSVAQSAAYSTDTYYTNCIFSDATEFSSLEFLGNASIYSQNHDQTADNHRIVVDGGIIVSATDQRKTASGISWKMQPTSTTLRTASVPLVLSLAKVACAANSLVTVKAWMRRSDTGLTMRLVCKGGQIAGVDTDVVDAMTAAADTWAEQTITFTPTEVGVVEITAEAWGGTTHSGWVDDLTISQA